MCWDCWAGQVAVLGEGEGGACGAGQEARTVLDGTVMGVGNGEPAAAVERRCDGPGGLGADCGLAAVCALQHAGMPVAQGRPVRIPSAGGPGGPPQRDRPDGTPARQ